ncbi:MAG: ABC transporter ATP-binding protein [Hyphomicrobium sp.]|nr:ABC transporter ATP-binding protein [Hyphomicrobium sp.]
MYRWFESRIDPYPEQAPERPPATLAAFYRYFIQPVWPAFAVLLVVGFIGSVIELSLMAFIGSIVDLMRASETPQTFLADHAAWLLFMGFVALIARPIISTLHDLIKNQVIAGPVTTRVRWLTHRYVLRQSLSFYQNDFAGRVANKIMQTAPALRESVVQVIDAVWFAGIQWIGAVVLFAAADPLLLAPLVIWLGAYILAMIYFVPKIRERSTAAAEARSMLTGRIVDSYTNILTVKLFAHADREDTYAKAAIDEQMSKWQASLRLLTSMEFTLYTLNGFLIVGASGLAIWLWSLGAVSIGAIAVVTGLVIRIVAMSGWVLFTVAGIFENIGVVQEGLETISRDQEVVDAPDAKPLVVKRGEIRFEHIRFHYGRQSGIIDDLSLRVAPGEKVGLVGRSGAGKSTLVNLLLRFYDLEHGRILIDGQDIAHVTQDSLRENIGMVTQDTSLLHRSVLDNILYGRPDASREAATAAARMAAAHEFIPALRDLRGRAGYDAHVGERGVKLSGGQRQRIAIARVLLKNAPILILDEATSALDSEVEAAIQEQLNNLMQGKTVIAIAHRLSTIAAMDRLVIMDQGRIVEEGPHKVLLERGGIYAELWARQSGGFLAKEAAE